LSMMDQVLAQLADANIQVDYEFCRVLCSRYDINDPSQTMVQKIMQDTFGAALLPVPVLDSAEITHAALRMMTVYELEKPVGTARTHKRCRTNLDEVMTQVEHLIRRTWNRAQPASPERLHVA